MRYGETIPTGTQKAELVALLIQVETNSLTSRFGCIQIDHCYILHSLEQKEAETETTFVISTSSTSRKKHRKK